jgi:hypothetical protein
MSDSSSDEGDAPALLQRGSSAASNTNDNNNNDSENDSDANDDDASADEASDSDQSDASLEVCVMNVQTFVFTIRLMVSIQWCSSCRQSVGVMHTICSYKDRLSCMHAPAVSMLLCRRSKSTAGCYTL